MLIYGNFDDTFKSLNINEHPFTVDVGNNSTIEELKILITLQFRSLTLEQFDVLNSQRIRMKESQNVSSLVTQGTDVISILLTTRRSEFCMLI